MSDKDDAQAAEAPHTTPEWIDRIGVQMRHSRLSISVTESLTGGLLSDALARAEGASDWFLGGLVAYGEASKRGILKVNARTVVCADAAVQMATGAAELFGSGLTCALTGVGGPGPEQGVDEGTVFLAVLDRRCSAKPSVERLHFTGTSAQIVDQAVSAALARLSTRI